MNDYSPSPSSDNPRLPVVSSFPEAAAQKEQQQKQLKGRCSTSCGILLSLGGITLGILFCDAVLLSSPGLSLFVWTAAYQSLLWAALRRRKNGCPRAAAFLSIPILLISLGHLLYYNPSTRWIGMMSFLLLCALQLVVIGGVQHPFSFDAFLSIPNRLMLRPLLNFPLPLSALGALRSTRSRAVRSAAAVLLGIIPAIPVGVILLCLFSSADAVFGEALTRFTQALRLNPAVLVLDCTIGTALGFLLAACLLDTFFAEQGKAAPIRRLQIPALVTGAFLAVIDGITALFVAFQFVYLFGGEASRQAYGLTYAEYARRGFFELCAASGIVFGVTLLALLLTRRNGRGSPRSIRVLAALLCLCDLVVLASAFKRMALYISAYGMSIKRLLTLWGMALVAIWLLLLLIRCLREKTDILRSIGIAAVVGVCILSLLNTDRIVGSWNSTAMREGRIPYDAYSFLELSYSAAPEVEALRDALPEENRPLLNSVLRDMQEQLERRSSIYSFSFDRIAADAVFERLMQEPPEAFVDESVLEDSYFYF